MMKRDQRKKPVLINLAAGVAVSILTVLFFLSVGPMIATSGTYLDSSHANTTYGVNRSSISGYPVGLCLHCHESHASVGGEEPAPNSPAGPDKYLMFATNFDSSDALNNVCLNCHSKSTESHQSGGTLGNRTYSFRAGGYNSGFDNSALSIKDMLDTTAAINPPLSTHSMIRIQDIIKTRWNYTADSNPCIACHNPHKTKGDPANSPTGLKSAGTRGWPLSRPSQHYTTKDNNHTQWQLWGDAASERMSSAYPGLYYDPFRTGGASYEPDGSVGQQNGANLFNSVALCTDCHNSSISINSDELPSPLRNIDWAQEKHGAGLADVAINIRNPYSTIAGNNVLACTDCHEPHGAANTTLIRGGVNGAALANPIQLIPLTAAQCSPPAAGSPYSNKEMESLCVRCHQDDVTFSGIDPLCAGQTNRYYIIHHDANSGEAPPYPIASNPICANCHFSGSGTGCNSTATPINCTCCHYHNSTTAGRRTF